MILPARRLLKSSIAISCRGEAARSCPSASEFFLGISVPLQPISRAIVIGGCFNFLAQAFMFTVLILLIIIISILLTVVVLSQSSKGDGLSGSLGGPGGFGAVVGVRRAGDFLVRATIGLAIAFAVLTIVANLFFLPASNEVTANPLTTGAGPVPTMPQGAHQQQSAPAVQSAPAAAPAAAPSNANQRPVNQPVSPGQ